MYTPITPSNPVSKTRYLPMLGIVFGHLIFFYVLLHAKMSPPVLAAAQELTVHLIPVDRTTSVAAKPTPATREKSSLLPAPLTTAIETPRFIVAAPSDNLISAAVVATAATPAAIEPIVAASSAIAPTKQISAVEYLRSPQADYPPLARRMGEQGKVIMRVLVNEKGQAEKVDIQKSSGFNRLDEAARIAVMRALFKPYVEDGKPLMVLATAVVNFSLSS